MMLELGESKNETRSSLRRANKLSQFNSLSIQPLTSPLREESKKKENVVATGNYK